ncbi:MAG: peptidylprolyl isomerase [Phycisphaerales bacterium]|nr:peptidylprolyl isomerase [Phycisphaerales bacterium]
MLNLGMAVAAAGLPLAVTAQTVCPTFVASAGSQLIVNGGQTVFSLSVLTGVHMETNQGAIDITLLLDSAPSTSANFLRYVRAGRYDGSIFHRSVPLSVQTLIGVIQGGGFLAPTVAVTQYATEEEPLSAAQTPAPIAVFPPIALEHPQGNLRGTLSMARTADPNSATSQFFINTSDNNTDVPGERFSLDAVPGQPGREGYAVFGVVAPASLSAVDSIAFRPVMDISGILNDFLFGEVPLRRPFEAELTLPLLPANYVTIATATATATPVLDWQSGSGLTYRWRRNGVDLFDGGRFSGAGTHELTIDSSVIDDTGTYDCVVSGLPCGGGRGALRADGRAVRRRSGRGRGRNGRRRRAQQQRLYRVYQLLLCAR